MKKSGLSRKNNAGRSGWLPMLLATLLAGVVQAAPSADPETLCVMTFNVRFASPKPPNSWPERRPVLAECIKQCAPDLIGTQEGLYSQIKDMAADLPEYDWIGLGRDGGSRGEFMAVFFRRDRFEPLEFDHFWLSETPDVIGSTTWGNKNRRMVTWVKFRDTRTDRQFYFWNTHLDHEIQPARENSARLIRQKIEALNTTLPILLVGDFNATAGGNPVYDMLLEGNLLRDTWHMAAEKRGELVKTFHGFRGPTPGDQRIDWILAKGPFQVDATEILTFAKDGQYPSDHFPVVAWLKITGEK